MTIWLLIKSDSKTSLSCLMLIAGLTTAHTFLKVARKRIVLHLLVVVVVLSCFSVLFLGIGGGALQTLGRNSTLTGRTDVWEILLKVPINPIVGTGFESFWLGKRLQYLWTFPIVDGLNEAHNGYFEVYLNLGCIGLALLAGIFWTGYRNVLRLLDRDPEAGRLRLGYFVSAVIYNFTEAGIRTSGLVWIGLLLAAIALPERALARLPASENAPCGDFSCGG
jgi:O-antigen ligase